MSLLIHSPMPINDRDVQRALLSCSHALRGNASLAAPGETLAGVRTHSRFSRGAAADWPMFRGNGLQTGVASSQLPDRAGGALESRDQATASRDRGHRRWDGLRRLLWTNLYALDLATGKQKWKIKTGPIKVVPSVENGAVYVGDLEGGLFIASTRPPASRAGNSRPRRRSPLRPISPAETVLFGSGDENALLRFQGGQGALEFKVPGGPVLGSPAVIGGRTFVVGLRQHAHVIDSTTGKELGHVELDGQTGRRPPSCGDRYYVGTMTNQVSAVDWKKAKWPGRSKPAKRPQPFYASAAVTGRLVIAGSRDKNVYGLDRKTGKEVWSFPTQAKWARRWSVGSSVYVGSMDGNLYVLDLAARERNSETPRWAKRIAASPAVAGRLPGHRHHGRHDCIASEQGETLAFSFFVASRA